MSTDSPAPKPKKRRRLRRLMLVLVSLCVALSVGVVGLELYLRSSMGVFHGPAFDLPGLFELDHDGWPTPQPNYEGEVQWHGRTTSVKLNSQGMRGEEFGARQSGETRILAVGDSVVFGLGVEAEETFAFHLERLLSKKTGEPWLVGIGGAPGFGTLDLGVVVQKLAPVFEPNLILAGVYLGNDHHDNFRVSRTVVGGYLRFGVYARMAESFRLRMATKYRVWFVFENFLTKYLPPLAVKVESNQPEIEAYKDFPPDPKHVGGLFLDRVPVPPETGRILDRMEQGLRDLKRAAGEVPVLVLILPRPEHCGGEFYEQALQKHGFEPEAHKRGTLQRLITERCERLGFDVLDVTTVIEATGTPYELYLADRAHFSVLGHEVVAEHLASVIDSDGR